MPTYAWKHLSSIHCQNNLQSSVAKCSPRTIKKNPQPSPSLTLIWNYLYSSLQLFNSCSKHGAKIRLPGNMLQNLAMSCSSFTKALKYFPRRQGFRDEQLFIPLKKSPTSASFEGHWYLHLKLQLNGKCVIFWHKT